MTKTLPVNQLFSLGDVRFSVNRCAADFATLVDQLFIPAGNQTESVKDSDVFHYTSDGENIRQLIDSVLKLHPECLWIDAAALITPQGKKILLTGKSGAGKSTTTLALALKYGWKMIAEDVLLINRSTNRLVNFPSPCSLKANAPELLLTTIGIEPSPLIGGEWLLMGDLANTQTHHAPFDIAINLELVHKHEPLFTERISVSEFCRAILANSNALRTSSGLTDLQDCLEDSLCFKMISGTLEDRLAQILHLSTDSDYATTLISTSSLDRIKDKQPTYFRADHLNSKLKDDGSLLLICAKTKRAYHFSQLGALVFEFCDGFHTPKQIASEIQNLFPLYDESILVDEITKLLCELESLHFIKIGAGT